ncbi:toprim domain-containing protein [Draconibacterium orientale]|uniref:toprim domain-containing protein n=1 Tax=Draconibacterium orientale TaxID=1168034 RepID=UPI002ABE0223|nr:toprim domain-containing protein [Draconibacterium orientale]
MGFSKMQCDKAREIPITEFLKRSGFSAVKENQNSAWYLSPIRNETEASFKVSKALNRWYDHGVGKGGNIIDLVIEMNNGCSVSEALSILDKNIPSFSFQQQENFAVLKPEPKIRIDKVLPLRHPALVRYLTRRNINVETAARYAKEIHYSLNDKRYFAIGLENISGGWELRNPYYKNAAAPKDYSFFSRSKKLLSITEGMFDFFSLLTLYPGLPHKSDFLILNSVSFVSRVQKVALSYSKVGLYLDNDLAGKRATKQLMTDLSNSVDMSALYEGKKDLNQLLTAPSQRLRRSVR